MKRWIFFAAALAAVVLMPARTKDVGELLPLELLSIYKDNNQIHVETDTGEAGVGDTLTQALEDLKATAPGEVFLETADYLIVTKDTVDLLPQLTEVLRPATEVCLGINADTQAAAFLSAHKPGVTLKDCRSSGQALPRLIKTEERYRLVE